MCWERVWNKDITEFQVQCSCPHTDIHIHVFVTPDQQIMTELLIHEGASNVGPSGLTLAGHQYGEVEQYSSSSEEEGEREGLRWKDTDQSKISDSSEEEEQFTMKVCVH